MTPVTALPIGGQFSLTVPDSMFLYRGSYGFPMDFYFRPHMLNN